MTTNFINACALGRLTDAKRQYNENATTIDISEFGEYAFRMACLRGHLPVAKWLLEIKPTINISEEDEYAFRYACLCGHLHIVQWLLKIKPTINISTNNEWAFNYACRNGHLLVAQWLLKTKPTIDISMNGNWTFICACRNGHLPIAKWFLELNPYKYEITLRENNTFEGRVRTKEEAKEAHWQHIKYAVWAASDTSPNRSSLLYKLPFDVSKQIIQFA